MGLFFVASGLVPPACDRYDVGTPAQHAAAVATLRLPDEPSNLLRRSADASFAGDHGTAISLLIEAGKSPDASERKLTTLDPVRISNGPTGLHQDALATLGLRRGEILHLGTALLAEADAARAAKDLAREKEILDALRRIMADNPTCPLVVPSGGPFDIWRSELDRRQPVHGRE